MEINKLLEEISVELRGITLPEITLSLQNKKSALLKLEANLKKAIAGIDASLTQLEQIVPSGRGRKKRISLTAAPVKGRRGRKPKAVNGEEVNGDTVVIGQKRYKKRAASTGKKAPSTPRNGVTYKEMILNVLKEKGSMEPVEIKNALVERYGVSLKEAAQNSGYYLTTLVGKKVLSRKRENKRSFYSIIGNESE